MLFIYPPMVILSALGVIKLIETLAKQKYLQWGVYALVAIGLAFPLKHIIANHPHEYVYFNSLAGGVKGAYGDYEMDYFYHSQKAAADWLIQNRIKDAQIMDGKKIVVGMYLAVPYYFRDYKDKVKVKYIKYSNRGAEDWDYYIMPSSFVPQHQLKNDLWPPVNTIHTIDVDGKPICAIYERENRHDLKGSRLLMSAKSLGSIDSAIVQFKLALKADPNYDFAQMQLTNCYRVLFNYYSDMLKERLENIKPYVGKPGYEIAHNNIVNSFKPMIDKYRDSTLQACDRALMLYPDRMDALNLKAEFMFQKGDIQEAIRIQKKNAEINPNGRANAYMEIVKYYYQLNDLSNALVYAKKLKSLFPKDEYYKKLVSDLTEAQKQSGYVR